MVKDRSGDGQFTPEHTDAEILAAVRAHEPAATSEVAEEVGMTRQGADRRLRRLRDDGRVSSKKIGASLVWFAPVAEKAREPAVTPSEDTPDRSDPSPEPTREPTPAPRQDAAEDLADAVDAVAEQWDDTPDRLADRKAAARAVLEYAREQGTVSKQEALDEIEPEYPVERQTPRTWYRKNVRPVLNNVAEYDKSARGYRLDDTLGGEE